MKTAPQVQSLQGTLPAGTARNSVAAMRGQHSGKRRTSSGVLLGMAALALAFGQLADGADQRLVASLAAVVAVVFALAAHVDRSWRRGALWGGLSLMFVVTAGWVVATSDNNDHVDNRLSSPAVRARDLNEVKGPEAPTVVILKNDSYEFFETSTPLRVGYLGLSSGRAELRSAIEVKNCSTELEVTQRALLFYGTEDPVEDETSRVWLRVTLLSYDTNELHVRVERLIGYYAQNGDWQCNGP